MITVDTPTRSRPSPANGMITVDTPARRAVIMPLVPRCASAATDLHAPILPRLGRMAA
jgi:hypothetical protein